MLKQILAMTAIVIFLISSSVFAERLTILTENYPPFNYVEDGAVVGIGTDVLLRMAVRSGIFIDREDIQVLPWARAYRMLLHKDNTLLYSIGLTKRREPLLKWVGPFYEFRSCIFAKKGSGVVINGIEDVNKYKIGTVREDAAEQTLIDRGISIDHLKRNSSLKQNVLKLNVNRLDGVACGEPTFLRTLKQVNADRSDYEVVFVIDSSKLYYGLNKKTDPMKVKLLQKALDSMREDGALQKIIMNYM